MQPVRKSIEDHPPIVYVANRLPWPLDDGWKRRTFAMLEGLASRYDVVFVAPAPLERSLVDAFRRACGARVALSLSAPEPPASPARALLLSLRSGRSPLATRHVTAALANEVDSAVARSGAGAVFYAGAFLAERHASVPALRPVPYVIDTHNIDSHAMSRRVHGRWSIAGVTTRIVSHLLRRAETRVFAEAAATVVCSPHEVGLVHALAPSARVHVVPNGVDIQLFPPAAAARVGSGAIRLLFFGHLDYPPNVEAMRFLADAIHPALCATGVPFHITVAGAGDGQVVRRTLAGLRDVDVIGKVSDVARAIHESDAVIVPLRSGGGTRLKVLEALAAGRLVVSTTVGSEGIEAEHGKHLWTADTPAEFARALVELAERREPLEAIATAGAALVRERYSWVSIQRTLTAVLAHVVPTAAVDLTTAPGSEASSLAIASPP